MQESWLAGTSYRKCIDRFIEEQKQYNRKVEADRQKNAADKQAVLNCYIEIERINDIMVADFK